MVIIVLTSNLGILYRFFLCVRLFVYLSLAKRNRILNYSDPLIVFKECSSFLNKTRQLLSCYLIIILFLITRPFFYWLSYSFLYILICFVVYTKISTVSLHSCKASIIFTIIFGSVFVVNLIRTLKRAKIVISTITDSTASRVVSNMIIFFARCFVVKNTLCDFHQYNHHLISCFFFRLIYQDCFIQ